MHLVYTLKMNFCPFHILFSVLIFAVGVECGENRGRTGGGTGGGNRGRPKEPGENRGYLGREPGENRGLLVFIYKEYRGRSGGFGTRTGGEPGGGNFLWNKRPSSGPENQRTGPPVKISNSLFLRKNHDSQRRDRILRFFSPPGNRATFSIFWGDFRTIYHHRAGPNFGQSREGYGRYDFPVFSRISVSTVDLGTQSSILLSGGGGR